MPKTFTLRSAGNKDVRLLMKGEKIAATVLAYSNGKWGLFDQNESRSLTKISFNSAKDAEQWANNHPDRIV